MSINKVFIEINKSFIELKDIIKIKADGKGFIIIKILPNTESSKLMKNSFYKYVGVDKSFFFKLMLDDGSGFVFDTEIIEVGESQYENEYKLKAIS